MLLQPDGLILPRHGTHHHFLHSRNPPAPNCWQAVGDVCFGSVMGPSSQRANECRIAMFLAGFPTSVPVHTVNRQCSSGAPAAVRQRLLRLGELRLGRALG